MGKLTEIKIDYLLRRSKNVLLKVNSLDDTKYAEYIVYKRGRKGTNGYECGNMKKRMKKKYVTWQKTGEVCNNDLEIWEILEK